MGNKVTKAIFPVAGLGTRFLPATKAIPKEVLPLVDRPLIQYAIDEARAAGIKEFIFVTSRGKSALEDYFDLAPELERALEEKGKTDLLSEVRKANMDSGQIAYVRQTEALGLGHAVWCARRLIGPEEPVAVLLPDDVIASETPCLEQMMDAYMETGGAMVATMEVPREQVSSYGVLDVEDDMGRLVKAKGMVEKPKTNPPSNLAVIGRYILPPSVFTTLNDGQKGAGGEIQLTDAIAREIKEGRDVYGYRFQGRRFDCGSKSGFLKATVAFGLARPDLGHEFSDFLRDTVAGLRAAE
ncbi:UDP-glucose pyrophosphorylase [Albimonas donghaensis]|uniref:UTP--glucose-1-phosphate uridylyltransferase n=1 Tax=Albimonas donghaensis TaxID=356660 RepID=A0A1H2TSS1_9RHOB|nr:UTP--glucose-1-phosphate uridylyltransferase GalU [Albimonas donghaensis]SDW46912.1 UDP-glucose pyrophosphorylase [Albimonas donghaensis]